MSTTEKKRPAPIKARSYSELFDLLKKTEDKETLDRILNKIIPLSDNRIQAQAVLKFTERESIRQRAALKRLFEVTATWYEFRLAINFALDGWQGASCNPQEVLTLALADIHRKTKEN